MIDMTNKYILDGCCGSKMMWFDRNQKNTIYVDKRELSTTLCDGRSLEIKPDVIADFTNLPFENETFYHVVFDPPHLNSIGEKSWLALKYGRLDKNIDYMKMLSDGFNELWRVLKPHRSLVFKWNEYDIPVKKVIEAFGHSENLLYGNQSGKRSLTHWLFYYKFPIEKTM